MALSVQCPTSSIHDVYISLDTLYTLPLQLLQASHSLARAGGSDNSVWKEALSLLCCGCLVFSGDSSSAPGVTPVACRRCKHGKHRWRVESPASKGRGGGRTQEIKKSDSVYPSGRSPLYLSLTLTDIDIKTPACSLLLPCHWFLLSSADWADFIASPA